MNVGRPAASAIAGTPASGNPCKRGPGNDIPLLERYARAELELTLVDALTRKVVDAGNCAE